MSTSSTHEKPPAVGAQRQKKGWFKRNPNAKLEENPNADVEVRPVEPEPAPPVSFARLFRFSTKFELFIDAIGIIAAIAAGAAQPMMSLLFGNLTQEFVIFGNVIIKAQAGDLDAIAGVPAAAASFRREAANGASYLAYIGVGMFVCTYAYMYIWVYTGEVNSRRIREKYLRATLRQDIAYFDHVGAGEVATRIQTDTHLVQQGISEKVALVANFIGAFLTGFVLAYVQSWRLALAMSSMLPCIGITGGLMNKFMSAYMQLSLKHVAAGGALAEEVISTIRTAQAFGTQTTLSELYGGYITQSLAVNMKAAIWRGGSFGVFIFVIYSGYALAFYFGTTLINNGSSTPGEIVTVIFAILIGSFSLVMLAPELQAVTQGKAAAAKLFQTIDRVPAIDSANEGGQKPKEVFGEISLENVTFSYPSRPTIQVVKDLSLTFKAGRTSALVGASGSGKSTIVSLVERFYDPLSGAVKLDGNDVQSLNLKWLRSQIGLVSQEPTLFATTIKGNVAHGLINTVHEHDSEEEKLALIKEACVKANADGFISKLPNGYDTMVGERGFLLSGGQKQRIAIARAIVSDPSILLLDEATSALDTQSEEVVQDALDKAAAGRTTIAIAHRLSTIKDADTIFVMGDGRVLESGSHNSLLAKDGAYARLVHAQKLRESQEGRDIEDTPEGSDDGREAVGKSAELAKEAREEMPFGRRNTDHSLASAILEQRKLEQGEQREQGDFGVIYLFKRMLQIVQDQWKTYIFATIFAFISGMAYPAYGVAFAKSIEGFSLETREERRREGDRNALYFFIIAIVSTIAILGSNYLFSTTAAVLTSRLRTITFRSLLRQDIEFFDKQENNSGSLTAKLSDDPQKVDGLAGVTLGTIIQAISTLICGSALGLAFSWKIALVAMACIPVLVSPGYIRLRVVVLKDQANKKSHSASSQLACEAAGSIRTVASLTREDDCLRVYSESLEIPLRNSIRSSIWSQAMYSFSQSTVFFVIALVFWYGSRLVSTFDITPFEFFVSLMSTTFGAMQAGNFFSFVPDMSSARGAASDIIKLMDSTPEIDAQSESGKKPDPASTRGHIRFENVHFRYPSRQTVRVLRNFSFDVIPGSYVALVGASGSGKSTVIQLIERFYDALAGEIYLDGEKITDLNVKEYRKQLALVSQEPTLYAGTIRFNILLGAIKPESEVTQEEIEAVCRDANILEFIQSLPEGFDTPVGGKGSQLSGGQKQRIAIARALLRNPKVLLLDEATSALDSSSEKVVQLALDQASRGRTTISIAHRLSTIQNADCIYFVKEGRISESGTHDQLLAKGGDYYEYVQLQGLAKND